MKHNFRTRGDRSKKEEPLIRHMGVAVSVPDDRKKKNALVGVGDDAGGCGIKLDGGKKEDTALQRVKSGVSGKGNEEASKKRRISNGGNSGNSVGEE